MAVVEMLQSGKLALDPSRPPGTPQNIQLPPEYQHLAKAGGYIVVQGDVQAHTIDSVYFYEIRGCQGDCANAFVFVPNNRLEGGAGVSVTPLRRQWFWVDVDR
jgi:hypothetical protein